MLVYSNKAVWGQCVSQLLDPVSNFIYVDRIIELKALAFSNPEIYKLLKCNIYEAKPEDLSNPITALPQAAMAAIIKAQGLQYVGSYLI